MLKTVYVLQTRILVTHGVHWLPMVDRVVVLNDGIITEQGTYEELISRDGDFAKFLQQYINDEEEEDEEGVLIITVR